MSTEDISEEVKEQKANDVEVQNQLFDFPHKWYDISEIISLLKNLKQRRNALYEQPQTRSIIA